MSDAIKNKLILFADNTQLIKKEFAWHSALTVRLAAFLYAQEGKRVDCNAIRQSLELIKQNTGVFSAFRGNLAVGMAALLSLSPDPQLIFGETLKVYDLLKSLKLRASDYLVVAAYQIAAQANPSDYTSIITRTRAFYDGMKSQHFFYTGQDDYIFTAMLGLSELDPEAGSERIERLYSRLKVNFTNKNSVQALAQVLVLGGSDYNVADRVLALRDAFRAQKIRLDKTYTLPTLGILALLPAEPDAIVRDIDNAVLCLREQKGFGSVSVSRQEALLFTASLIAGEYTLGNNDGIVRAAVSTSITNIILAQHAAMIAAVSASAASASSSS